MFHYRSHNSPPLFFVSWRQINDVHSPSYFLKIHFNIIFPSTLRSFKCSLSLSFPHRSPLCTSVFLHTCHTLHPSRSSYFDRYNFIWWVQVMKILIMQSSPLPCSFFRLYSTYLLTTISHTLSLCFSCSLRDQVSHPCNTRGKIILMYIVIFIG
jgi:hypothetical protein